ncbi:hypothetical protein RRG08_019655 [Elysia crispata]|uniref:Uncharacterized protein n=1 Tax=Elysia crispata TaxID=231223 RepID=A0AAE1B0E5_9GAST|nr:hypothetical protein RRG08_019655 [Elysia crispata]
MSLEGSRSPELLRPGPESPSGHDQRSCHLPEWTGRAVLSSLIYAEPHTTYLRCESFTGKAHLLAADSRVKCGSPHRLFSIAASWQRHGIPATLEPSVLRRSPGSQGAGGWRQLDQSSTGTCKCNYIGRNFVCRGSTIRRVTCMIRSCNLLVLQQPANTVHGSQSLQWIINTDLTGSVPLTKAPWRPFSNQRPNRLAEQWTSFWGWTRYSMRTYLSTCCAAKCCPTARGLGVVDN